MKKLAVIFICFGLASCYFGANESGRRIANNFYLVGWDEENWKIVFSTNADNIYAPEKIIVNHDVFALGNNDNFIIAKQHPCENKKSHIIDLDSLKPNKEITNYYIIDIRDKVYKIYSFDNAKDFKEKRTDLRVPISLSYSFYDRKLE
ncbi:MAG: DUF3997 domain-containing protein [Agriterribacter sp.]